MSDSRWPFAILGSVTSGVGSAVSVVGSAVSAVGGVIETLSGGGAQEPVEETEMAEKKLPTSPAEMDSSGTYDNVKLAEESASYNQVMLQMKKQVEQSTRELSEQKRVSSEEAKKWREDLQKKKKEIELLEKESKRSTANMVRLHNKIEKLEEEIEEERIRKFSSVPKQALVQQQYDENIAHTQELNRKIEELEEEVTRLKRENESACGHHSNKYKPPTSPAEIDSSGTFDVIGIVHDEQHKSMNEKDRDDNLKEECIAYENRILELERTVNEKDQLVITLREEARVIKMQFEAEFSKMRQQLSEGKRPKNLLREAAVTSVGSASEIRDYREHGKKTDQTIADLSQKIKVLETMGRDLMTVKKESQQLIERWNKDVETERAKAEVFIPKFEGEYRRGHINTQGALPKHNHDQELADLIEGDFASVLITDQKQQLIGSLQEKLEAAEVQNSVLEELVRNLRNEAQKFHEERDALLSQHHTLEAQRQTDHAQWLEDREKLDVDTSRMADEILSKTQQVKQYKKQADSLKDQLQKVKQELERQQAYFQEMLLRKDEEHKEEIALQTAQFNSEKMDLERVLMPKRRELEQLRKQRMSETQFAETFRNVEEEKRQVIEELNDLERKHRNLEVDYLLARDVLIKNSIPLPQRTYQNDGQIKMETMRTYQEPTRWELEQLRKEKMSESQFAEKISYVEDEKRQVIEFLSEVLRRLKSQEEDSQIAVDTMATQTSSRPPDGESHQSKTKRTAAQAVKPYDPNLVCLMCGKGHRIGDIQKYRYHVDHCNGNDPI